MKRRAPRSRRAFTAGRRRSRAGRRARATSGRSLRCEPLEDRRLLDASVAIEFRFTESDAQGASAISSVVLPNPFYLQAYVQDGRDSAAGIVQAYLDVDYNAAGDDPPLAVLPSGAEITRGTEYETELAGTNDESTAGLLDEAGGTSVDVSSPVDAQFLLFSVPMQANAMGILTLDVSAATELDHGIVDGSGTTIPFGEVEIVLPELRIRNNGPAIHIEKYTNGEDADEAPGPEIRVGDPVTWTYEVTNWGNQDLFLVTGFNWSLTDDNGTPGTGDDFSPDYVNGDVGNDSILGLDETWIYTHTGTATAGQYANVATVTETIFSQLTDSDPSHYFGLEPTEDWGDAPAPYPTLSADNGARHEIGGPWLGDAEDQPDGEWDGQPDDTATGDNLAGSDDENGLSFPALYPGQRASVDVSIGGGGGYLYGWIDFNGDGVWDLDERVTESQRQEGAGYVAFRVPEDAVLGQTYARFRISSEDGLSPEGPASDGEVEDYLVTIEEPPPGVIRGTKWNDLNGNAARDEGEPGLADWRIYVDQGTVNGVWDVGEPFDWTDENGDYEILDVPVGINVVAEEMPAGWTQTYPTGASEEVLLIANFDDKAIDEPIGTGGAEVGEPSSVSDPAPIVRNEPMSTPCLEFQDTGDAPMYAVFDLLDDAMLGSGTVIVEADVWMEQQNDYSFTVFDGEESLTQAFVFLYFRNDGRLIYSDGNSDFVPLLGTYEVGRTIPLRIEFDMDHGLYDLYWDDARLLDDEPHGITGRTMDGIWCIMYDREDTEGTSNLDNLAVTHVPSGEVVHKVEVWNEEIVEDVDFGNRAPYDYGDAPDGGALSDYRYATVGVNAARHLIDPEIYLGEGVDGEGDGQPSLYADGDDRNGDWDEDGVWPMTLFIPGQDAEIAVGVTGTGYFSGWIDLNRDGDWDDDGERVFADEPLATGEHERTFSIPSTAQLGPTYARCRFSTEQGLSYNGEAPDGEVEDYDLFLGEADFGDAPDPYPTYWDEGGAAHSLTGVGPWLGSAEVQPDGEWDGQPDASALGDDNAGTGDENGTGGVSLQLVQGETANIPVIVSGSSGYVQIWIDFNGNGAWEHPAEQVYSGLLGVGEHTVPVSVPVDAVAQTFARYRISSQGGLAPTGWAADGEVEDHAVVIQEPGRIEGVKWADLDGNEDRDLGEPGLAGWTLFLDLNGDGLLGLDDYGWPEPHTRTMEDDLSTPDVDETGFYGFPGLLPGEYTVVEVVQTGWTQIVPTDPTVVIAEGQVVELNFGNQPGERSIRIEKRTNGEDADSTEGPMIPAGSTVTFTYEVTNTGDLPLTNVVVTDDGGGAGNFNPNFDGGDDGNGMLDPGETWEYSADATAQAGPYENVATVAARFEALDEDASDDDPSHYFGVVSAIAIEKATNGEDADTETGPLVAEGDAVLWTYVITNPGNVSLTITLTDDQGVTPVLQSGDDGDGFLDPDEEWIYEATGTAVAGQYENVATVSGTAVDDQGVPIEGISAATDQDPSHYFGVAAGISIEKKVNGQDADTAPGLFVAVGATVVWTYEVVNTGNVDLDDVVLTDDQGVVPVVQSKGDGDDLLEVGETWVYQASGVAVADQQQNTATVTAVDPLQQEVADDDPSHYFGVVSGIVIEKATNGEDADTETGPLVAEGDAVLWTYVITNPGNVSLTITLTDDQGVTPVLQSGDDGDGLLQPDETWTYEATDTAVAGQYENLATVSGTAVDDQGVPIAGISAVNDDDPSHYFGVVSGIDIEKSTNGQAANDPPGLYVPVGTTVTWTYEVTNTGNVGLENVAVADDQGVVPVLQSGDDGDGVLELGETWIYEATGTAVAGQYGNTAAVTALDPLQQEVTDDDPSHYFGVVSGIVIEKSTNGEDADTETGALVAEGGTVEWTYEVFAAVDTNVAQEITEIVDDNGTPGDTSDDFVPTFVGGDDDGDGLLDLDEVWQYSAQGTAQAGQYGNSAKVTAVDPAEQTVTDDDPSHYFGVVTSIDIEKATNGEDADEPTGRPILIGTTATFTYVVTNTGNWPLHDVEVTDDGGGAGDFNPAFVSGDTDGDGLLDPDETWEYTADHTVTRGQYGNVATATAFGPLDREASDEDASHHVGDTFSSTLSGVVYVDSNDDAEQHPLEPGIPGVTITLNGTWISEETTTTADDGSYLFEGLPIGAYTITETHPSSFMDGQESLGTVEGTENGTVGDDEFTEIDLWIDQDGIDYKFGELGLDPDHATKRHFLAKRPTIQDILRKAVADAAEEEGDAALAAAFRADGVDSPSAETLAIDEEEQPEQAVVRDDGDAASPEESSDSPAAETSTSTESATEAPATEESAAESSAASTEAEDAEPAASSSEPQIDYRDGTVSVTGTDGDDHFEVTPQETQLVVTVNGRSEQFPVDEVDTVTFDGGKGSDTASLTGSAGDDEGELHPGSGTLKTPDFEIRVDEAEQISVDGGDGVDRMLMYDSPGSDRLEAAGLRAALSGDEFFNETWSIEMVWAISQMGGDDEADDDEAVDFVLEKVGYWMEK
ncbi:MAG TPA: GEVED domain-containing protein [Thermoguttaceae bacterium]|nr:GEVED domain-containing protein [Thermoguttaceae bacterium]